LGIKQLFDDPWPTILSEFPISRVIDDAKIIAVVDYGAFLRLREGVEAFVASSDVDEETFKNLRVNETLKAEVANIDMVERRLIMSARNIGEVARPQPRQPSAPSTSKATLGDLLKEKLSEIKK
ncbi:MAG TPA: S1 RNA-binding domain-containing protein, partial [Polyangiaceae bacterium]|nr:S1 RNA-binding domain-containing protein [Polyangiaceae bacterium]